MSIDATKQQQSEQMAAVQGQSQCIGDFIEWLNQNGMLICKSEDGLPGTRFVPILESNEQLVAKHFDVDLNAVERERRVAELGRLVCERERYRTFVGLKPALVTSEGDVAAQRREHRISELSRHLGTIS